MKIQQLVPVLALALTGCATAPTEQTAATNASPSPSAPIAQLAQVTGTTPAPYPPSERLYNHEGRVIIDVRILTDGSIGGLELANSSGWPALDEAALRSMEKWTFSAATDTTGKPVESNRLLSIGFRLADPEPGERLHFFQNGTCCRLPHYI